MDSSCLLGRFMMVKSIEMIYEDQDILVCRKPAGVATQTKRLGQQDMESLLKNYRVKKAEQPYIGIVHRLDQPVEGLMVFAKNAKAASVLSKQIQQRMIGKYYYAVSAVAPAQGSGELVDYLVTDKKTNYTTVIEKDAKSSKGNNTGGAKDAKEARLEYTVVKSTDAGTLFDVKLHTGRQHQIRVQMAHMGCPLIGDAKYGVTKHESELSEPSPNREEQKLYTGKIQKESSLALCSYRLQFAHPSTGKQMDFRIVPQGEAFGQFTGIFPG